MFRRGWASLPEDPKFGDTLEELGYFINENDEIRLIEKPDTYFNYWVNTNPRWNDRQKFEMNVVIQKIVHERLEQLEMKKIRLPLGATPDQPHVPIFISKNLAQAKHIILLVPEAENDLGVLAHRVITGLGGINTGSMVESIKHLQETQPDVGLVIANPGQLWWWHEGKRGLTMADHDGIPLKSAVCWGFDNPTNYKYHQIRKNESPLAHLQCIFDDVLANPEFCSVDSRIHVICLGIMVDCFATFLKDSWDALKSRLASLQILGGTFLNDFQNSELVQWIRDRAIAFILSSAPEDTLISTADGNPNTTHFTGYGCPVIASGEQGVMEMIFIRRFSMLFNRVREIAEADDTCPEGYKNPSYGVCTFEDPGIRATREDEERWKTQLEAFKAGHIDDWNMPSSVEEIA